jgi:hypothetical protein
MRINLLALAALCVLNSCSSSQVLSSSWLNTDILVDGQAQEWDGMLTPAKDVVGTSYGLRNDADALYVCLVTNDAELQRQIMMRGLVLWVDPQGGKNQHWGLQFPLGIERSGWVQEQWDALTSQSFDATAMRESSTSALEVIGPGSFDRLLIPNNQMSEVQASLDMSPAGMIYEARIPLALGDRPPYGPGVTLGNVVGIGFVSPKLDRGLMTQGSGSGRGTGGPPGRGGDGAPPPGGGFEGAPPRKMFNGEINIWTQVAIQQVPEKQ